MVGITPNGSEEFRRAHPKNFHNLWGLVHPQLSDNKYLQKRFRGLELRIGSISGIEGLLRAGQKNLYPLIGGSFFLQSENHCLKL